MRGFVISLSLCSAILSLPACTNTPETSSADRPGKTATPAQNPIQEKPKFAAKSEVDVPALANQPPEEFDRLYGPSTKISPVRNNSKLMPGEYREYRVPGHPKGLSVRFYRDKAKRFNLLLGKEENSGRDALRNIFKIDVGPLKRVKTDPLSDTWNGEAGGISYKTAYAKRSKTGGKYVMLHAEVY